jgi:uncharacterized protein
MTNRLAAEPSLYLRQHADNPLDWQPWGEAAFAQARARDCPVLLSIGYSSCYWCHVMEHDVFAHADVAAFMNPRYVCIKVDREERPDVDAMYMQAAQLMTGGGGWPLNVWLTPDLRPVFAGTYFPKSDFLNISDQIAKAWQNERDKFEEVGHELAAAISASVDKARPGQLNHAMLDTAARAIVSHSDPQLGGLASRVKFPEPVLWEFLLRQYSRSGDAQMRALLTLTLDSMHDGGLYDHIGGGWHRYSTDRQWLVPHFEKMLYDNAQLAALYASAARVLEEPRYAAIARDTLNFMQREMRLDGGAYAASYDASSGGVEGSYYVWTPEQLRQLVGEEEATELARVLGVEETPNFEDHHGHVKGSVITRRADDPQGLFENYRPALGAERDKRVAPGRDDKVVTAWNAMAVSGGAGSGALDYLLATHIAEAGRIWRASNAGQPSSPGVLEDYALLAKALLDTPSDNPAGLYLQRALQLIDYIEQHFANPDGGYFQTMQTDMPFARGMNIRDTVEPSGNSVMAHTLLKAALLTGSRELHDRAGALLERFAGTMAGSPLESAHWLSAVELHLGPYYLVVVAAAGDDPAADSLIADVRTVPSLNYELVRIDPDSLPASVHELQPVLDHKPLVDGRATVYVCAHGTCSPPVQTAAEVRELLLAR